MLFQAYFPYHSEAAPSSIFQEWRNRSSRALARLHKCRVPARLSELHRVDVCMRAYVANVWKHKLLELEWKHKIEE